MVNRQQIRSIIVSPIVPLSTGYLFLLLAAIILTTNGFFVSNDFFAWGPPVNILGSIVESQLTFYLLLFIFFFHQLINSWVSEVTYPFIINEIQDPKAMIIRYSRRTSLMIALLNALYSQLDLLFVINGSMSQVSFFVTIIVAQMISVYITNWCYLIDKRTYNEDLSAISLN